MSRRRKSNPAPDHRPPARAPLPPRLAPAGAMLDSTADHQRHWRLYAAEVAKQNGLTPPRYKDGDAAIKRDYRLMLALSRDMYRNNGVYKSLIDRYVDALIGEDGVEASLKGLVAAERDAFTDLWAEWTDAADWARIRSFTEIERWFATEICLAGKALMIKHRASMRLQLVNSERIERIDAHPVTGRVERYWVKDDETGEAEPVEAEDAIYYALAAQANQIGGCGVFWCCLDVIEMIMLILRSSAKSWALQSRIGLTVNKQDTQNALASLKGKGAPEPETVDENEIVQRMVVMDDVMLVLSKTGEETKPFQQAVPVAAIEGHLLTYLRVVTAVIGCDAATFIWQDYSKTNYVASRAAAQGLRRAVGPMQNKLKYRFYNPVYHWLVGTWVNRGELPGPYERWRRACDWILPIPRGADDKTEAEADALNIDRGFENFYDVLRRRNKDPREHLRQRAEEIRDAVNLSRDLSGELGIEIPYQLFCGLQIGKTEAAVRAGASEALDAPVDAPGEPATETAQ